MSSLRNSLFRNLRSGAYGGNAHCCVNRIKHPQYFGGPSETFAIRRWGAQSVGKQRKIAWRVSAITTFTDATCRNLGTYHSLRNVGSVLTTLTTRPRSPRGRNFRNCATLTAWPRLSPQVVARRSDRRYGCVGEDARYAPRDYYYIALKGILELNARLLTAIFT